MQFNRLLKGLAGCLLLLFLNLGVFAQQTTRLIIRAKAKDAKFIGTGIGGAYVVVRDNLTGEVLAKGLTTGASGNTDVIMNKPWLRGQSITDSVTAKFEAVVSISVPTFVDIDVLAPVNRKNASIKATTQAWLLPGKDILGEGIVLEIPGFIVDVLLPNTHEQIKLESMKNGELPFKASVTMACGCPITKGGVWNSENIEVKAIVSKEGKKVAELPLALTAKNNIFNGILKVAGKGNYELIIYAYDRKTGNTGVDKINFVVQ
jgi:hypothetical protein